MRRNLSLVILSLFLITCAGLAFAQPPGGRGQGGGAGGPGGRGPGGGPMGGPPGMMMGGGPGGPGMMMGGPGMGALFSEEGRQDIGLSERQINAIQTIFAEGMRPDPNDMPTPPGPNATDAERQAFRERMQAMGPQMQDRMQQRLNETIKKVEGVMTKEQLDKSRARSFQAGGGFASLAMNPFAQAALDVTERQKGQIREFQQGVGEKMQAFMRENNPPGSGATQSERDQFGAKMRQFMEDNRKEMETKIQGILTDAQKKKGEELIAATPEYIKKALDAPPPGPMNRGGGAPPQGPGGGFRPGADSWRPGQGAPGGGEAPANRFPGNRNRNNEVQ